MNSTRSKKQETKEEIKKPDKLPTDQEEVLRLMKLAYTYETACAVLNKGAMLKIVYKSANTIKVPI